MKLLFLLTTASAVFAGGLPKTEIRGNYIEARTADVLTGACFANSEVNLTGDLALFGWTVSNGQFEGVPLDGLSVVGVVRAHSTLGDIHNSAYPVKSVLLIDDRATPEQRLALKGFAQRMGGDLLNDIVKVVYTPIELTFADNDVHSRKATLRAGDLASIETRAVQETDMVCKHEEVWYTPLTKLDHAMPAYAIANSYRGEGLDAKWSSPDKRSAYVGTFHLNN